MFVVLTLVIGRLLLNSRRWRWGRFDLDSFSTGCVSEFGVNAAHRSVTLGSDLSLLLRLTVIVFPLFRRNGNTRGLFNGATPNLGIWLVYRGSWGDVTISQMGGDVSDVWWSCHFLWCSAGIWLVLGSLAVVPPSAFFGVVARGMVWMPWQRLNSCGGGGRIRTREQK
jgi:hypothetical protein